MQMCLHAFMVVCTVSNTASRQKQEHASGLFTFIADLAAYQMAPTILSPSPTLFHTLKRKSPNANAPTRVMMIFFKFPAVLVMIGSLTRVHTNVEWLTVSPSMQLSAMETCSIAQLCPIHCYHQKINMLGQKMPRHAQTHGRAGLVTCNFTHSALQAMTACATKSCSVPQLL